MTTGAGYAVLTLGLWSVAFATTPAGFKARITSAALNYASTKAMDALAVELPKTNIPDQSGSSGHVSYSLENIRITRFSKPSSSIQLNPGQGLTWSASNAGIDLHADWHAKYKQGWFKVSDHGSLDASLSGVSFSISIAVRADSSGRPEVAAAGCSCSIRSVDIKFHGDIVSKILDLFRGQVERKVRDIIPGKLCDALNSQINNNAEQQLKKLKVVMGLLDDLFLLDYRLVQSPSFQTGFFETNHKGEITWKAKPEQPPFSPAPMPSSPASQNMLYLWIGQYLPQSFVYAAQHNGFLQYNLTAQDLPPGNRSILNTTCTSFLCVGRLIPEIGAKYPGSTVRLHMNSTTMPVIRMDPGELEAKMAGDIAMYAQTPHGDTPYLLTLNVSATFNMSATIANQLLVGKITGSSFKVGVLKSAVGELNAKAINAMVGLAMKLFIIPKMNEKGAHGFPLPVTDQVKFVSSKLEIQKNALMIATDLQYDLHF
ncbi:hypothetical protein BaRGS_00033915 [Batillaria attramentaria]|uniref:Bactericidal permeability-increasing protein n=1 Tax=Batillaria attramentaria TaxID=370345 RepID=A0ABD0JJA7_9CAEN